MSLTPLWTQDEPYKCAVCGKSIRHGERVDAKLICCGVYQQKGNPDGDWILNMDWQDIEITHVDCIG